MNRKLKTLGMPHYLGCGSHYYNNERYRFIVLPKYGIDLQTVFLNSGKRFSVKTAFTLATYVVCCFNFLIKCQNIYILITNLNYNAWEFFIE